MARSHHKQRQHLPWHGDATTKNSCASMVQRKWMSQLLFSNDPSIDQYNAVPIFCHCFVMDHRDDIRCETAAARGDLEALKQARCDGCPWDERTCSSAAGGDHLDVLQWARQNNCPWDSGTCCEAAEGGHLEVLQWARQNGCPWGSWTCARAALGGHLEVLQWAHKNGCGWDSWTCSWATRGGQLEVLKWACENGCPWDSRTCHWAASEGHVEILRWALKNGCEWDGISNILFDKVETLQLAYEHRVPYNISCRIRTNEECSAFFEGDYGEAWRNGDFGLPHYWKCYGIK